MHTAAGRARAQAGGTWTSRTSGETLGARADGSSLGRACVRGGVQVCLESVDIREFNQRFVGDVHRSEAVSRLEMGPLHVDGCWQNYGRDMEGCEEALFLSGKTAALGTLRGHD